MQLLALGEQLHGSKAVIGTILIMVALGSWVKITGEASEKFSGCSSLCIATWNLLELCLK
jgi:hypothetical protein